MLAIALCMLSILIPIYQQDVQHLVWALHQQGMELAIPFEIRCIDDKSDDRFRQVNRSLAGLDFVVYTELENNLGRAAIRNALGKAAQYPFLLFIDGDARVVRPSFLRTYFQQLRKDTLLVGGTSYQSTPPANPNLYLRWTYGSAREARPLAFRQRYPWQHFSTFQFVIPKPIHQLFPFDEKITEYGHEDTLLGTQLAKAGIEIVHLDNPLEHLGLDTAAVFLEKTDQGIRNLLFLKARNSGLDTRLSQWAANIPKPFYRLLPLLPVRSARRWMRAYLLHSRPALWLFDLYKLLTYIEYGQSRSESNSSKESTM